MSSVHLGIVELGDVCLQMADRDDRWFERLGRWVVDETDPATQRLYADACHRHAWHADLWRRRAPAIAHVRRDDVPGDAVPDGDRADAYREALRTTRRRLASLRGRFDPELDPSTLRVITLIDADVTDLEHRLGQVETTPPGPSGR